MPGRALIAEPAPAAAAFDRRLEDQAGRPIAVALSGGGDSLLALGLTLAWARPRGRPVTALIVDHRLQAQSAVWARFAAESALALGAAPVVLPWTERPPATGIAGAARLARHRLLAAAARQAGARVIVTGHTASDGAENAVLGQGPLREWTPSPAWPQGRGVFLLRPLLDLSREAVRARLRQTGARWIDDPANSDERHPRVRARRGLGEASMAAPGAERSRALAREAVADRGALILRRDAVRAAPAEEAIAVIAAAAVCAGGGARLPRGEAVRRLCKRLAGAEVFTAALAGALIVAGSDEVAVFRNAGDIGRTGGVGLEDRVWDGRYAIPEAPGGSPTALRGHASRLPAGQRLALADRPAPARPSLPVLMSQDGPPVCPILAGYQGPDWQWLVPARFSAACGLIAREGQL